MIVSASEVEVLECELLHNLARRAQLFEQGQLRKIKFCLRLMDVADNRCFNLSFANAAVVVRCTQEPDEGCLLWL